MLPRLSESLICAHAYRVALSCVAMLIISSGEAVELPVDELAMVVLRDLTTSHEVHEYIYSNDLRQDMACDS